MQGHLRRSLRQQAGLSAEFAAPFLGRSADWSCAGCQAANYSWCTFPMCCVLQLWCHFAAVFLEPDAVLCWYQR
jgi:hypothetical protein